MGAFEGSLSFTTFYVNGEPPSDFHQDYIQKLNNFAFEPLSPVGDEERHIGWVSIQQPLETSFQRKDIFFNQYIIFGMRIDKWSIPTPWLKARLKQAIDERFQGQDVKISKRVRDEIKNEVTTDIKQHILPTMKIVDVAWNITEQKVRLWSVSKAICEEFAELFEQTFGLPINQDSPFLMAKNLGLSERKLQDMILADPWYIKTQI